MRYIYIATAMVKKAPTKKPQQQPQPPAAKKPDATKRLSHTFLADISAVCLLPSADIAKVIHALRHVMVRELKDKKKARIPNVCTLRVKTVKARGEMRKVLFGVEKVCKPRPASKKVVCRAMRNFNGALQ